MMCRRVPGIRQVRISCREGKDKVFERVDTYMMMEHLTESSVPPGWLYRHRSI